MDAARWRWRKTLVVTGDCGGNRLAGELGALGWWGRWPRSVGGEVDVVGPVGGVD